MLELVGHLSSNLKRELSLDILDFKERGVSSRAASSWQASRVWPAVVEEPQPGRFPPGVVSPQRRVLPSSDSRAKPGHAALGALSTRRGLPRKLRNITGKPETLTVEFHVPHRRSGPALTPRQAVTALGHPEEPPTPPTPQLWPGHSSSWSEESCQERFSPGNNFLPCLSPTLTGSDLRPRFPTRPPTSSSRPLPPLPPERDSYRWSGGSGARWGGPCGRVSCPGRPR